MTDGLVDVGPDSIGGDMRETLEFGCRWRVQVGVDRVFDRVWEGILGELAQRRLVDIVVLRT